MASIRKVLRGYICDEREKNWSREFAAREISQHKEKGVIDHPDESITTEKLRDGCVTAYKLSKGIVEKILNTEGELQGLQTSLLTESRKRQEEDESIKTALDEKADKSAVDTKAESDLSNVSDEVFFAKLNSVLPDGDEVSY